MVVRRWRNLQIHVLHQDAVRYCTAQHSQAVNIHYVAPGRGPLFKRSPRSGRRRTHIVYLAATIGVATAPR